ncbi:MAG TPA: hypothetical protein VGI39_31335 [Polyangiaceae bacterium]
MGAGRGLNLAHAAEPWLDPGVLELPTWGAAISVAERAARVLVAGGLGSCKHALHWAAGATGLPVVVVAALALVLAWRVVRRTWHVALEIGLALALLLVATRDGWIRW